MHRTANSNKENKELSNYELLWNGIVMGIMLLILIQSLFISNKWLFTLTLGMILFHGIAVLITYYKRN